MGTRCDLRGVEEPGGVGAADSFDEYAVGCAGDEFADVTRSHERRHGVAVGLGGGALRGIFVLVVLLHGLVVRLVPGIDAARDGGVIVRHIARVGGCGG